jgi:hypothetical protein
MACYRDSFTCLISFENKAKFKHLRIKIENQNNSMILRAVSFSLDHGVIKRTHGAYIDDLLIIFIGSTMVPI